MISSISTCPECNTLVLSDTVQCPSCHHVLHPDRAQETIIQKPEESTSEGDAEKSEVPCRECGVMVRKGVVRCWNCGGFQEQDIEARFFEMQESEPEVILSQIETEEAEETEASDTAEDSEEYDADYFGDDEDDDFFSTKRQHGVDDDFELAEEVDIYEATDDDEESESVETQAASDTDVVEESADEAEKPSETVAEPDEKQPETEEITSETDEKSSGKDATKEQPVDDFENLFNIAMLEEAERESRLKRRQQEEKRQTAKVLRVNPDGTIVVGPACQCLAIVVQPAHFGKLMRCPKCHEKFRVPSPRPSAKVVKTKQEESAKKEEEKKKDQFLSVHEQAGEYLWWLEDVRLHVFNLEKTKPVAGVVEKKYFPVDIGFSNDHVLIASLATKPGHVGKGDKKIAAIRKKMKDALKEEKPLAEQKEIAADEKSIGSLAQFELIFPAAHPESAILEGQPIFGEGRIGIKVPKEVDESEVACLSMTLSQYREFCRLLAEFYGYAAFTIGSTIPFFNQTQEVDCQVSKEKFEFLNQLEYYQADDSFDLQLIGWECESCHTHITEKAREETKLGGKGAKAIAKAKCPTCSQKMGNIQLMRIKPDQHAEEEEMQAAHAPAEVTESVVE